MRPLIPPVCLTEGGFPLANFKLAFTIECANQRESRRGDEHDEIRDNCSDGFGVDCHRKCARTDGGGQEVRDQSSKPAFSQAKAIRTAPSFASQAMMGFSVGTESGPEIRS
jgi:hypothetical protein